MLLLIIFFLGCDYSQSNINEIYFQWARPRMYLHQATLRMMAGAAPNKTRQLLDRSLIQKSSSRGLLCGKGEFS